LCRERYYIKKLRQISFSVKKKDLKYLNYMTSKYRESRVKQVLADLALIHVANRKVENLTPSEYRRVVIGVQMIKDPIVMLLDEPAWGLDPLNTYLIVSILSNHAKKYNRIMVVTMEKPRATYLCLGDVVYTGSTRLMLDYFRSIGFPCPELENPLMYYLCLSTVDRRSRDRFIDSNNQIAALVERFRGEGGPFRKYAGPTSDVEHGLDLGKDSSNPYIGWLLFGSILWTIYGFVEQQTAALMLFIKSSYNATATCVSITSVSLVYYDNFYYLTYGIIFRYVSAFLHEQMFYNKFSHFGFNSTISCESNNGAYGCRYSNGSFYLLERFHISGFSPSDDMRNDDLAFYRNFGVPFAFVGLMTAFNIVLYLVPLPAFIKSKFRE
ncbi:ATP-binding cassette sub-family G member 5, partial [Armadillidium nasatum]